jgi:hypothetical protein
MLITKLTFCLIIWREMKIRFLPWALLFVSIHLPFITLSRMGNPEVAQVGFFMLSLLFLYYAEGKNSSWQYFISGLFLGITFFHKPHNILLLLAPALFFFLRTYLYSHLNLTKTNNLKNAVLVYSGLTLYSVVYFIFWLVPNMADFLNMLLLGGGHAPSLKLGAILSHLTDVFMSSYASTYPYIIANALWLLAPVILILIFMLLDRTQPNTMDVIVISYAVILYLQLAYYYTGSGWNRVMALIPLGSYAVLRLVHLAIRYKFLIWQERLSIWRRITIVCCIYVLLVTGLNLLGIPGKLPFIIASLAAILLGTTILYWVKTNPRLVAFLLVTLLAVTSIGSWRPIFDYLSNHNSIIRDNSLKLTRLGTAKSFGLYQYSLYNTIDDNYVGTCGSSANKPTNFTWASSQGLSMPQLAKKYRFRSIWAFAIWVVGEYQPELYDFWVLPPDYVDRYQSDVFLTPPPSMVLPSRRYLLVGAYRPELYITKGWIGILHKYANKIPVVEEYMDFDILANNRNRLEKGKIFKVLGWKDK